MATTVSPGVGEAPFALQAGVGASPGFSAVTVRRAFSGGLQEGVIDSGTDKVTTGNSGLSVSVAASTGEGSYVQGDDIAAQGLYHVAPHSAAVTETCDAADATNPRIDQLIKEVVDDTHSGGGANLARYRIVKGTPTSGADLDDRLGAASLPTSVQRCADILVPAGFSGPFVNATHIRDRRTWARGAKHTIIRTGGDYDRATNTHALVDATNLQPRIECSGVPLRVKVAGNSSHTSADGQGELGVTFDAVAQNGVRRQVHSVGSVNIGMYHEFEFTPAAGSHLVGLTFSPVVDAQTFTLAATAGFPLVYTVEETRPSASND